MPKKKKTSRKRRVLSGLSGTRGGCKRVSRSKATHSSGKKKGKLKKGCRFLKGDGAQCCPASSRKRKTKRKTKRRSKRKTSKKTAKKTGHYYSSRSSLPFYKKKVKGKKKLKKGCSKVTRGKYKGKIRCKRKMSRSRRKAA